jgi:thymidylate synthase (FAD)
MKDIKIELLNITPQSIALNALSKSARNKNANEELLQKVVVDKGHLNIAEHIVLNWNIEGVSRLELIEHTRHRIGTFTIESTRYVLRKILNGDVDIDKLCVYPDLDLPEFDNIDPEVKREFQEQYLHFLKDTLDRLQYFKDAGMKNDLLKYFLPESLKTNISWTVNLTSMLNFLEKRMNKRAHFEIRYVAKKMYEILKGTYIAPLLTWLDNN